MGEEKEEPYKDHWEGSSVTETRIADSERETNGTQVGIRVNWT